jgi:hypothetical protein
MLQQSRRDRSSKAIAGEEFDEQGASMIEHYQQGSYLKINGTQYYDDLKIIDGRVKGRCWRSQGHRLQTEDIFDIRHSIIGLG